MFTYKVREAWKNRPSRSERHLMVAFRIVIVVSLQYVFSFIVYLLRNVFCDVCFGYMLLVHRCVLILFSHNRLNVDILQR
jgi:hypothetical protein